MTSLLPAPTSVTVEGDYSSWSLVANFTVTLPSGHNDNWGNDGEIDNAGNVVFVDEFDDGAIVSLAGTVIYGVVPSIPYSRYQGNNVGKSALAKYLILRDVVNNVIVVLKNGAIQQRIPINTAVFNAIAYIDNAALISPSGQYICMYGQDASSNTLLHFLIWKGS